MAENREKTQLHHAHAQPLGHMVDSAYGFWVNPNILKFLTCKCGPPTLKVLPKCKLRGWYICGMQLAMCCYKGRETYAS